VFSRRVAGTVRSMVRGVQFDPGGVAAISPASRSARGLAIRTMRSDPGGVAARGLNLTHCIRRLRPLRGRGIPIAFRTGGALRDPPANGFDPSGVVACPCLIWEVAPFAIVLPVPIASAQQACRLDWVYDSIWRLLCDREYGSSSVSCSFL
jgi:hypothetical protein